MCLLAYQHPMEGFIIINGLNGINPLQVSQLTPSWVKTAAAESGEKKPFSAFFDAYMNILDEANEAGITADQLQIDFAAGKTDDMLAMTLAMEKASVAMNFTVQVTNKILSAYQEIMRIQM